MQARGPALPVRAPWRVLALWIATALPALADSAAEQAAYRRGFEDGVAAVNAQLGALTVRLEQQVQAQVNAQLAETQARRDAELDRRLTAAQAASQAAPITAMPRLPPLTVAPGGGIVPTGRTAPPGVPDDPARLPPGTTITITDPQNLPPDLFRALMAHVRR